MGLFRSRSNPRGNFTMVAVLMVGIGLFFTFMSLRSLNYLQTEGLIIQSDVTGTGKSKKVTVRYAYAVNQVSYDHDRVSYSLQMFRNTGNLLSQYPVGKRVPVYYSITDPSYAVLEKGFSFGSLLLAVLGGALFVGLRLFRR